MTIFELHSAIQSVYPDREASEALFNEHFITAIMGEGVNEETAKIISGVCYELGHSGGNSEIVNYAYGFTEFAKRVIAAQGGSNG